LAATYNNIGVVYSEQNQYKLALENLNKALQLRIEANDISGRINTLNELGNLFEKNKAIDKCYKTIDEAYNLAVTAKDQYYTGLCGRKLGSMLIARGQTERGLMLLEQAVKIGQELNNAELNKNAHLSLFEYYNSRNDFARALEHFQQYSKISENVQTAQNSLKMQSLQQSLELERNANELRKAENEVKLLRQEKEKQQNQIMLQRILLGVSLLIIVLIIIIGFMGYGRYKIKRKHNQLLQEQNQRIEEANSELKKREEELIQLNATKDKFFTVIAHDIRNPLNTLLNLSHIIIEKSSELKAEEVLNFNQMIHDSASNLNTLLENLLNWAKSNTNKMRLHQVPLKLKPAVNGVILIHKITAHNKHITLTNNVPDDIEVYADQHMLTSILRNLISNAIKFTPEGGEITILAKDTYWTVDITVTDTGQGISSENIKKLFRLDHHFSTLGTLNEAGTGLGLILVKEFAEKNNGKISVSSEQGKGSSFTVTLPTGKD